jgi:hypothetical protein
MVGTATIQVPAAGRANAALRRHDDLPESRFWVTGLGPPGDMPHGAPGRTAPVGGMLPLSSAAPVAAWINLSRPQCRKNNTVDLRQHTNARLRRSQCVRRWHTSTSQSRDTWPHASHVTFQLDAVDEVIGVVSQHGVHYDTRAVHPFTCKSCGQMKLSFRSIWYMIQFHPCTGSAEVRRPAQGVCVCVCVCVHASNYISSGCNRARWTNNVILVGQ